MTLPGYQVNITGSPPNPSEFTDIDTLFAVGQVETPNPLELIYSIDQFESLFGVRQPASPLYDALQVAFREGLYRAYISGIAMTGLDADLVAALANFTQDLGPGVVAAPGHTTAVVQLAVAAATNAGQRLALLDAPDTATIATVEAAAAAITGQPGDQWSAMFGPWDIAPGLTPGTTRTVPPSGRIAGNLARNSTKGYSPGDPAAGALGIAQYVQDVDRTYSDADRTTLNGAGVNISRISLSSVRTYGFRSLASQTTNPDWSYFASNRVIMAIKARLSVMAENFVFDKIDGAGVTIKKWAGAIAGVLIPFYVSGDLYGATESDAFSIDTGPAVNTPASIAAGQLNAQIGLRTADMAEQVIINVAKVPITEALA